MLIYYCAVFRVAVATKNKVPKGINNGFVVIFLHRLKYMRMVSHNQINTIIHKFMAGIDFPLLRFMDGFSSTMKIQNLIITFFRCIIYCLFNGRNSISSYYSDFITIFLVVDNFPFLTPFNVGCIKGIAGILMSLCTIVIYVIIGNRNKINSTFP